MGVVNVFEKLPPIVDFLKNNPTREQLVVYLSENVCPLGEVAGVNTGRLDDDGTIRIEFFHGFNASFPQDLEIGIGSDSPAAETLRTMKVTYVDLKNLYTNYTEANKAPGISDYETGVGIPAGTRRIYGFAFTTKLQSFRDNKEYFECLRAILGYWESMRDSQVIKRLPPSPVENRELTLRQKRILELVKEDRTNSSIATILGYSESLIRQETIIIYRKLGVDGRKELKSNNVS